MLLQVLMCLLVGNLVRLMVWNLVWFLGLRSSLGPELESNLILGLGSGLTFGLESDLKANFSWTGWYLVLFCAHPYYILYGFYHSLASLHLLHFSWATNSGGITRRWKAVSLATWGGPWWLSSFRLSIWPSNNNVPWSMSSSDLPSCTSTSNPLNGYHMDLSGIPLVPVFNLTGPTTKPFSCRLAVDSVDLSTYWGLYRHSLFGPGPRPPAI